MSERKKTRLAKEFYLHFSIIPFSFTNTCVGFNPWENSENALLKRTSFVFFTHPTLFSPFLFEQEFHGEPFLRESIPFFPNWSSPISNWFIYITNWLLSPFPICFTKKVHFYNTPCNRLLRSHVIFMRTQNVKTDRTVNSTNQHAKIWRGPFTFSPFFFPCRLLELWSPAPSMHSNSRSYWKRYNHLGKTRP